MDEFKAVSKTDGSVHILYQSESQSRNLCFSALSKLVAQFSDSQVSCLDLSHLHPIPPESWPGFMNFIFPLLHCTSIQKIVVDEKDLSQIEQEIKEKLFNMFKDKIGETVLLFNQCVSLKTLLDFSSLTSKLKSYHGAPDCANAGPCKDKQESIEDVGLPPKKCKMTSETEDKEYRKPGINTEQKSEDRQEQIVTVTPGLSEECKDTSLDKDSVLNTSASGSFCNQPENKESRKQNTGGLKHKLAQKEKKGLGKKWSKHNDYCYICKQKFQLADETCTEAEKQYRKMCCTCAEFNFSKRCQRVDLTGKIALVTGGRIKIGYELVLKMLRDGCQVITTTRFPHDAARRFTREADFNTWSDRLTIYPLDLQDIRGIYKFIKFVQSKVPHLDILVNNAAQTIRRPREFYIHILDYEAIPHKCLPKDQQGILSSSGSLCYLPAFSSAGSIAAPASSASSVSVTFPCEEEVGNQHDVNDPSTSITMLPTTQTFTIEDIETVEDKIGHVVDAESHGQGSLVNSDQVGLRCHSKVDLNKGQNEGVLASAGQTLEGFVTMNFNSQLARSFPNGAFDEVGQQLDLRRTNSWRSRVGDVTLFEMLEVFMVNAISPFILNKELKAWLKKSPAKRRFIVNVSAMEGQFERKSKTMFHPHTNMAKAAVNMMTRTAALEYQQDNIYMTSVDTGWITDERPFSMAKREREKKGFQLPLDSIDGAARIYDPIVQGYTEKRKPWFAVFLKDYKQHAW